MLVSKGYATKRRSITGCSLLLQLVASVGGLTWAAGLACCIYLASAVACLHCCPGSINTNLFGFSTHLCCPKFTWVGGMCSSPTAAWLPLGKCLCSLSLLLMELAVLVGPAHLGPVHSVWAWQHCWGCGLHARCWLDLRLGC